jgi:hypothetical protein|tara:strand:- start:20456 stop:20713 length:258 start_codon:yes stop_codon:yes gene_type:complete
MKEPIPEQKIEQQSRQVYAESNNLEAHIIADMLRIESITTELREFKEDTKHRLNKIENWLVAIVGTSFTTLLALVVGLLVNFFGQ